MILLVDIGNTRIKWATFDAGTIGPQSALPHDNLAEAVLLDAFRSIATPPQRVMLSSVAAPAVGDLVRGAAQTLWGVEPVFVASSPSAGGVRNAYDEPWRLGVDRWLAVIAAHAMESTAVCIVSVGTAMTIDAVDRSGQHLGGLIVPGPELMVRSLLQNTSGIARRAEQGSVREGIFADNTLGAIRQGSVHALAALVERAMATLQADLKESPALLLTGGDHVQIQELIGLPAKVVPDLVLRGLAVLAAESSDGD